MLALLRLQVLVADRLIEARSEALNGHVFCAVSNERLTNLSKEPDLLPLTRRERTCMSDGILYQEPAPLVTHASARSTADLLLPQPPLSGQSSMHESFTRGARTITTLNGRHLEDTPGSSPRVAADTVKGTQAEALPDATVYDQRGAYFGRDKGHSRVSGFW